MDSNKDRRLTQAITVRQLKQNDALADLIELSRVFFAEYAHHDEQFFQLDELRDSDVEDYFRRSLNTEDGATFVACLDDRMVGYITVFIREQPRFYMVKRIGTISGLMVAPQHRRKGIAGKLLGAAKAFFRQRKIAYITVYTAVANVDGLRFYERHGMKPLHSTLLGCVTEEADSATP